MSSAIDINLSRTHILAMTARARERREKGSERPDHMIRPGMSLSSNPGGRAAN